MDDDKSKSVFRAFRSRIVVRDDRRVAFGFTLAEVLIAKRARGELSLLKLSRVRELKEPSNKFFKQCAFTLAEVLITLGIIGVVAAMTLPVLISAAEKQATISGYKKAYSTLQSAVKLSEVDNGQVNGWGFPTVRDDAGQITDFFNTYLKPYLSIAKACESTDGCWEATKRPDGGVFAYNGGYNSANFIKYIIKDGMALSMRGMGYFNAPTNLRGVQIFVDINGPKKPNTMGKDVFAFWILENAAPVYDNGLTVAQKVKMGGLFPDGYNLSVSTDFTYKGCSKSVTYSSAGSFCGIKIINDGWQIKSDYPW